MVSPVLNFNFHYGYKIQNKSKTLSKEEETRHGAKKKKIYTQKII